MVGRLKTQPLAGDLAVIQQPPLIVDDSFKFIYARIQTSSPLIR